MREQQHMIGEGLEFHFKLSDMGALGTKLDMKTANRLRCLYDLRLLWLTALHLVPLRSTTL